MIKLKPAYFTPDGLKNYKNYVLNLEEKMKELESVQEEICSQGSDTWHDNAGYDQVVIELRGMDRLICDAYDLLNRAKIINYTKNVERIFLGSKINLIIDGTKKEYSLVGYGETNIKQGKILYESPLGKSLLGKEEGDKYKAKINGIEKTIEIKEINTINF